MVSSLDYVSCKGIFVDQSQLMLLAMRVQFISSCGDSMLDKNQYICIFCLCADNTIAICESVSSSIYTYLPWFLAAITLAWLHGCRLLWYMIFLWKMKLWSDCEDTFATTAYTCPLCCLTITSVTILFWR